MKTVKMLSLHHAASEVMGAVYRGTRAEVTAQHALDLAKEFFGDRELTSIRTVSLDLYAVWLAGRGLAPASVNRNLMALSKVFTYYQQRDQITSRPHFPFKRIGQGRLRWLTKDEEYNMICELDAHGFREQSNALMVLIDTGLRPSELWHLEARDIEAGCIRCVFSKTDRPRSVPMTERVRAIMAGREGLVFPYSNNWFSKAWAVGRRELGLRGDSEFVPYALRHTFASRLVQGGVDIATVSRLLGHSNIQQTMQYAHLSVATLASAIKVLG